MELLDTFRHLSVSHIRSLRDDDFFIDRLHHRYTVSFLILFCVIVTAHQYAGEPINCWVPAQFTSSFETYTNRLCWLQNTYYVHQDSEIPDSEIERRQSMVKYYQWIHLILLFQALLFVIPRVIWRSLNDKCGIEIVNYVEAAMKYETVDKFQEKEKIMDFLSNHIRRFIRAKHAIHDGDSPVKYRIKRIASYILFWTGKNFGNYLMILYLICKLLYLVNVIGQLFLMSILLGIKNYHALGLEILGKMGKGGDLISNHYFPKVSHCDFKVRELGNDHHYTVQCVLSINIFTEKMYVILWFWFVILAAITAFDLIKFIINEFIPMKQREYVRKHVRILSRVGKSNKTLSDFSSRYLKNDVIFVIRILSHNVNAMVASELTKHLWELYCKDHGVAPNDNETPISQYNDDNDEYTEYPGFPTPTTKFNLGSHETVNMLETHNENKPQQKAPENVRPSTSGENKSVIYSSPPPK